MLERSKASAELTLYKVIYPYAGKLSYYRRLNITLGGRSSRGGFANRYTPASLRIS